MFDELLQSITFGNKVIYKNEEYFLIHALESDYYLAIKTMSDLPSQVYLININNLEIKR